MKKKAPRLKTNPVAKEVRSRAFRPQVVKAKKGKGSYSRKGS